MEYFVFIGNKPICVLATSIRQAVLLALDAVEPLEFAPIIVAESSKVAELARGIAPSGAPIGDFANGETMVSGSQEAPLQTVNVFAQPDGAPNDVAPDGGGTDLVPLAEEMRLQTIRANDLVERLTEKALTHAEAIPLADDIGHRMAAAAERVAEGIYPNMDVATQAHDLLRDAADTGIRVSDALRAADPNPPWPRNAPAAPLEPGQNDDFEDPTRPS